MTVGVGAAPPRRGETPAPRPKPVGYSYKIQIGVLQNQ